jgi:carboxylate-amine ligase
VRKTDRSPQVRFGIEEEFFLCRADDHGILRRPSRAFLRDCRRSFGNNMCAELLQSQIELRTDILDSQSAAADAVLQARHTLVKTARAHGLCVLGSGTHPLAQWRQQVPSETTRYRKLFENFRIVAQRNLLCGLHVHVEVPSGLDRIRILNGVAPWLPMMLSLSASSPFWCRRDSGLMSYRQSAYDEWPRAGIPRLFSDEAEYRRYVATMVAAGAMPDESYIWWAIRPSAKYPTLELRITDACPDPLDSLCIAQLYRAAVRQQTILLERGVNTPVDPVERLVIEENRWRAKRFGTKAMLIPSRTSVPSDLERTIDSFAHSCEEAIVDLRAEGAVARAKAVAREGCSAERQLHQYRRARERGIPHVRALAEVVERLVATTQAA